MRSVEAGGGNSRLDEIQAAVPLVKLAVLDADNERRRGSARQYREGIANPAIALPRLGGEDDVVHLFVVRCAARERLRAHPGGCVRARCEAVGSHIRRIEAPRAALVAPALLRSVVRG